MRCRSALDHVAILPRGQNERFTIELGNRLPDEGIMRVRVRASRANADDASIPSLQLLFGWQASNEGRAVLPVPGAERAITASPDKPEFYQWDVPLGEIYPRNSVRKTSPMGAMPNPSEYIRLANRSVSQGPIRIDYVEVAAPVYDDWPPASHKRIFIDSENRSDEQEYAREVLATFMQRAWRRADQRRRDRTEAAIVRGDATVVREFRGSGGGSVGDGVWHRRSFCMSCVMRAKSSSCPLTIWPHDCRCSCGAAYPTRNCGNSRTAAGCSNRMCCVVRSRGCCPMIA